MKFLNKKDLGCLIPKKLMGIVLIIFSILFIVGCTNNPDSIDPSQYEHTDDELHDHSVEIEGSEMKSLTVQEVADLWEIDSEVLLLKIITEFELDENYTIYSILEEMREEYAFSPALIKDMAEEIKQQGVINE